MRAYTPERVRSPEAHAKGSRLMLSAFRHFLKRIFLFRSKSKYNLPQEKKKTTAF
jgi:hypothetical protein